MITEDYVSFETAVLLKEKGFNILCHFNYRSMYPNSPKPFYHKSLKDFNGEEYEGLRSEWFSAPTHQMAMKWLREVHKLNVNVCPSVDGEYWTGKWHSYVDNLEERYLFQRFSGTYNSYEEACEAAIKYGLKNLIS